MSVEVTISPPDQILVEAVSANEYNVIVTAQSAINVTVSSQSGPQGVSGVADTDYDYVKYESLFSSSSGQLTGGSITLTGGIGFSVEEGTGLTKNIDGTFTYVQWSAQSAITSYDGTNYIRINKNGQLFCAPEVESTYDIELGIIFTGGANTFITEVLLTPRSGASLAKRIIDFQGYALGALISSGCEVSERTTPNELGLYVSSGTLFVNVEPKTISATTTFTKMFYTTDYGWLPNTTNPNKVDPAIINDITKPYGSSLVAMTDTYWKKDLVLITPGGNVYYAYGQNEYASKSLANAAPLPMLPNQLKYICAYLAIIVCQKEDITISSRIADIRPNLSRLFEKSSLDLAYVPAGGTTHQVLRKAGNGDFDTEWGNNYPAGLDKEIQFNDNGSAGHDANLLYDKDQKALSVGKPTILPDNPIAAGGNVDSYLQLNVQNENDGISASADYIITADDGSDEDFYADFGLSNSNYNNPTWDMALAHDAYLWVDGGNISIGSMTPGKDIKFFVANTSHEAHPADTIAIISASGLNMYSGMKVKENGFNLTDMIMEASSASAETAAFAAGAKIVIRTDLI